MNCTDARQAISSAFDGDDLDLRVDRHLAGCTPCQAYADRLLAVRRHLRIGSVESAPNITAAVMARVERRRPRATRRRLVAVAAGIIALGTAGIAVGSERSADTNPVAAAGPGDILVAWSNEGLPTELGAVIAGWSRVDAATEARLGSANLAVDESGEETVNVEIFGYDPATYPAFASATNRPDLRDLGPTEALLSDRAAQLRGLEAGDTLTFDNGVELQIKGVVPDEDIAAAEVAVTAQTARTLGEQDSSYLLIEHDEAYDSIEADITAQAEGVSFRIGGDDDYLRGGDDTTPAIDRKEAFGEFSTLSLDDTTAATDPEWREANIADSSVPLLGVVTCHRQVLLSLAAAMYKLETAGLGHHIDPTKRTRCFTPRVDATSEPDLRHWGIVVDLNYDPLAGTATAAKPLIDAMAAESFVAVTDEAGSTAFVWSAPN